MELVGVDTQRAYDLIREKITTLQLAPGQAINDQALAEELEMSLAAIQEALKLLAHDGLVVITPRHGLYVADVNLPDLEQISETRLPLETLCARLAAQRATPDDIAVLEALTAALHEHVDSGSTESRRLFDLDHKFHQALAKAAHNKYLARTLDSFFGLSQRLWFLALPHLGFLPASVEEHLELLEAIKANDSDRAAQIMYDHVADFYNKVRQVLQEAES